MWWRGRRVVVPGGRGFLGRRLVGLLQERGAEVSVPPRDLRELPVALAACEGQQVLIDLAADFGGLQYQGAFGYDVLRNNLLLGAQILEAARLCGVERAVMVSSAAVYSGDAPVPIREDAPLSPGGVYGLAKRVCEQLAAEAVRQHGMSVAVARLANLYGPGDRLAPEVAGVVASLVRRAREGEDPLVVWGDGSATRSFLYVDDAARGLMAMAERMPGEPVNLASAEETSIRELATRVGELAGVRVEFDASKPAGRARSLLDTTRARALLDWSAEVDLREGLARFVESLGEVTGPSSTR